MRVLVTGGRGQLARAIQRTWLGHDVILLDAAVLDLCREETVRQSLAQYRPQVVINAGAFTQVDRCESEPGLAMHVNGDAVGWLAEGCDAQGACLIQVSTDYVFDGAATRPYREGDPTNPVSVYGRSKLEGERRAAQCSRHLVVRTSWLYDAWGRNFFNTMLNAAAQGRSLQVVDDQRGAPTTCRALARQLRVAAEEGWQGLLHATCHGETSWYGFAREIFEQARVSVDLNRCGTSDYLTPARRPAYSVLDAARRRSLGSDLMPDWKDALQEVVEQGLAG